MLQWSVLNVNFGICCCCCFFLINHLINCFLVSVTMWFHIKAHIQFWVKNFVQTSHSKNYVKTYTYTRAFILYNEVSESYVFWVWCYCVVLIHFPLVEMFLLGSHLTLGWMWYIHYLFLISVSSICVAPAVGGWYRAQVVAVDEETDACDIKFVDYGGYSTVNSSVLRQIRGDFMTLPFQAVECYLANVTPLGGTKHLLDPTFKMLEWIDVGFAVGFDTWLLSHCSFSNGVYSCRFFFSIEIQYFSSISISHTEKMNLIRLYSLELC